MARDGNTAERTTTTGIEMTVEDTEEMGAVCGQPARSTAARIDSNSTWIDGTSATHA
ncbi:MAG: hypothetical protein RL136_462 [Planctomycetota bacterium]|jgi:hypothetical protein